MLSIYVHIPFCRSKCFYCGFYSVASEVLLDSYTEALCREIEMRREEGGASPVATLYFGGGTPSLLNKESLERIVSRLENNYAFLPAAERTIEINPEDGTPEKLSGFRELGFNRISIGIQAFDDAVLKRIRRRHSAQQAVESVRNAWKAGFRNISADLMVGLPGLGQDGLEKSLQQLEELPLTHISVYMLSIDPASLLEKEVQKGRFVPETDDVVAAQFERVVERLKALGFEHYEISNFARAGFCSAHNTAYWQQKPYIGFGPSAHSYDGSSRQWNISRLKTYIESLNNNKLNFEREYLSEQDRYNEYIMTRLRTRWGADLRFLENHYAGFWKKVASRIRMFQEQNWVEQEGTTLRLTEKGWLVSDRIFSDLFVV